MICCGDFSNVYIKLSSCCLQDFERKFLVISNQKCQGKLPTGLSNGEVPLHSFTSDALTKGSLEAEKKNMKGDNWIWGNMIIVVAIWELIKKLERCLNIPHEQKLIGGDVKVSVCS